MALLQLSVAVAVPVADGSVDASHETVLSAGQLMVGAEVSRTVMVCVQDELLPLSSVAVHVRVMV